MLSMQRAMGLACIAQSISQDRNVKDNLQNASQ